MTTQPQRSADKWKAGGKCQVYDRETYKWIQGEIISTFIDEKGKWVKVQCDEKVHNLFEGDPHLGLDKPAENLILLHPTCPLYLNPSPAT